ncbi:MAG TPA: phytanoyl-CoA dioxygenase family protein, partial [Burkholderiales bacterium]
MNLIQILKLPFQALALASGAKSFADNPVIGSERLNRLGLHRARCRIAARMAQWRRARLAPRISDAHRRQFDENGFVAIGDFLPGELFEALRREATEGPRPCLEMVQGPTVTRRALLDGTPDSALARVVRDEGLCDLIRYAASSAGRPGFSLQAIRCAGAGYDPQTEIHADTFHATAKAWLFLHDVGLEDGPFFYVPGSHRRTESRLDWEHRQSLGAARHPVRYHARGSFRIAPEDLPALGLPPPRPMAVRANTLVVADTSGFHGRTPSPRATLRVEIYATLRRSPFSPWLGLHWMNAPGLRYRMGASAKPGRGTPPGALPCPRVLPYRTGRPAGA